jgi:subtilisin-like proprotein convertase family protein
MTRFRTTARIAALAVAAAATVATGAATATTASAATGSFGQAGNIVIGSDSGSGANANPIAIPDSGAGSLYPSPISLSGIRGTVSDVNLTLSGLSHTCTEDLDFLLVGPGGEQALVMSDKGDCNTMASPATLTLDDSAADPLPEGTGLTSGTFQPGDADYGDTDPFPAPAPDASGAGSALSVFDGTDPNGTWDLYVSDQYGGDSGELAGGWSLSIATDLAGPASPYPSTVAVGGALNGITDVNVTLRSLDHTYPDDVDVLLVGPQGQKAILMSDAGGGTNISDVNLTFDDEAAAALPDSPTTIVSGTYRPVNYGPELGDPEVTDSFPTSALDASTIGSNLSTFDGTNPNGSWSLYVVDDYSGDHGDFSGGWSLQISTVDAPAAPVITAPPTNTRDRDGAITMTGTAPANTTVKIYEGAALKASVAASATGQWSAALSGVPNGSHTFTATATDSFGNVSAASSAVTVIVDSIKPRISSTVPNKGAKHASVRANIRATASEALRPLTVNRSNAFIVLAGTTKHLKARVSWRSLTHTIVINPKVHLAHGTKYKVTITTAVLDLAGNPLDQNKTKAGLQKKTWKFTTR